jgi:hypothetical protein
MVCWLSVTYAVSASTPAMQEAAAIRREVCGVASDINRAPIANADVFLRATSRLLARTTTAEDGSFMLMANSSRMTMLVVSVRGFATYTRSCYGEARANGTRLQINRTGIRQFSAGADAQLPLVGDFSARIYGGTQTYDQTFSAVSADRASETLTRAQACARAEFRRHNTSVARAWQM